MKGGLIITNVLLLLFQPCSLFGQEQEVDSLISTLLSIMEPAMILLMGAIVLVIVLAILMPIFELNQLIK